MDAIIAHERVLEKISELKSLCQKIKNKIISLEISIQDQLYKIENNQNSSHSDDSY
jgi:hypothetical protein